MVSVCEKITDGAHNSPKSVKIGKPMASVKDLTRFGVDLSGARLIAEDEFNKLVRQGCKPEIGDVLIAKDGNSALDTVCSVDNELDAVLLSSVAILRPNLRKITTNFLKYYFCSKDTICYLKNNFISGAAIPRVVLKDFRKAKILLPPLEKQKKIVKVLGDFDGKIQLNNATNQTLEAIAQALFKSWFIDFDPVKAKITALDALSPGERAGVRGQHLANQAAMTAISGKNKDELDELQHNHPEQYAELLATAKLFPSEMQDSELGQIPLGWKVSVIKNIIERLKPKRRYTKKQAHTTGNIPIYEQGSSILLGYHDGDAGFMASPSEPLFIFGDHTCITYLSCSHFDISQNVIPLKGKKYPTMWVYYAVHNKQDFQEYRRHWSEFIIKQVVVPSTKDITYAFTRITTKLYLEKENNIKENRQLANLRDELLPKLLNGEI